MVDLSVIIPIGPNETELPGIVADLVDLPAGTEIIFALSEERETAFQVSGIPELACKTVYASPGRASQMNKAAGEAKGKFLWFLHADSKLSCDAISVLLKRISLEPNELLFHELRFLTGGPIAMPVNSAGVWFRSNVLKMPFGDQGFCIKRQLFHQLGRYPENVQYGEDHLFVWRALQRGIPVKSTGSVIHTSARKYANGGWFKITCLHLYLWLKQAIPQFIILLRKRLS